MTMSDVIIRHAVPEDAAALRDIYNHYVLNTPITFDVEPKTLEQRQEWLSHYAPTGKYRCYVAQKDGVAIGWASSSKFKDRAAYDTSIETSIYLKPGEAGQGLGRTLYTALFDSLKGEDIHRAYGGVTLPNDASVGLHQAMGFKRTGIYHEVGRKFGQYWDVVWFEKVLG